MDSDKQELIRKLRKQVATKLAEDIASVQPMPDIDFTELSKSDLFNNIWNRYCNNHIENPSDGDALASTGKDIRADNQ